MHRSKASSISAARNGRFRTNSLLFVKHGQTPTEMVRQIGVDGVSANAFFEYKDLINPDLAARQDKSTTLPTGSNTYFLPSDGANFVFSDLPMPTNTWLSHGKVTAN